MDRRQFIVATGATAAVGVAGCLHGGGGSDTGSPEDVVEAYLNSEDADEAEGYLHSESQIDTSGGDGEDQEADITVNNVEVTEEDLGEDGVSEWLSGVQAEYSSDAVSTIAGQSNAVVNAETTITQGDQETDLTYIFLTAEEDGDWLVVDITVDMSSMG